MAHDKVNVESSKEQNSSGGTSGRTVTGNSDGSAHVTTFVDIPGVGSLRSSYDVDSKGNVSKQHMTKQ